MPKGRLHRLLTPLGDVRPHEARAALYMFLFFFLITFPAYIIKAVKDSMLIGKVRPASWSTPELVTAVLIGFVVVLNTKLIHTLPRKHYITAVMLFFISNLIFFWYLFDSKQRTIFETPVVSSPQHWFLAVLWWLIQDTWPAAVVAFCFWSDVFIATSVTQFWIAVNDVFHPYQAKRMVGLFVTGGLLGGICGSLVTSFLARPLQTVNLLLFCPVSLVLLLMVVNILYAERKRLRDDPEFEKPFAEAKLGILKSLETFARSRYLRLLSGVLASAMIVAALVNFQFRIVLKARIQDADARTSFIGILLLGILIVSTVLQLFSTSRILRNFGIRMALLFAPSVLLLGSLSVFVIPILGLMTWACLMRGSDKVFDNTLSQSVRELLYIPIPPELKFRAKLFIDMFVNKFAAGFGAVLYLVMYQAFRFGERLNYDPDLAYADIGALLRQVSGPVKALGVPVVAFALIWIALVFLVHREYVGVVGSDIKRRWRDPHKVIEANLDWRDARHLIDTIQSRDKSLTLYVMNVYDLVRKKALTPEVKAALGSKEGEFRARSLDALLDVCGGGFFPGIEETLAEQDFEALVVEVMADPTFQPVAEEVLRKTVSSPSEVERMEAAKLAGRLIPTPAVAACLASLLQDSSPNVLNYALDSAAVLRMPEHIPLIVRLLGNPMTAQVAQDTLADFGPGIEGELKGFLEDPSVPQEIQRSVPEVLARLGTQACADILQSELARRREGMEQDVVDALYKLRTNRPSVLFQEGAIRAEVFHLIRKGYELYLADPATPVPGGPTAGTDRRKGRQEILIKRIFDLLTLIYPAENIVKAYQNILQGTSKSVDYSLELLDNILGRELKMCLFPLIEDLAPEERLRRLRKNSKALNSLTG